MEWLFSMCKLKCCGNSPRRSTCSNAHIATHDPFELYVRHTHEKAWVAYQREARRKRNEGSIVRYGSLAHHVTNMTTTKSSTSFLLPLMILYHGKPTNHDLIHPSSFHARCDHEFSGFPPYLLASLESGYQHLLSINANHVGPT